MKDFLLLLALLILLSFSSCAPLETLESHDLDSDYYKFVKGKEAITHVYADVTGDSVRLYQTGADGIVNPADTLWHGSALRNISADDYLYNSRFVKRQIDFDLSTIITKLRPSTSGVPLQLSANLNALVYLGIRKDFYFVRSNKSDLNRNSSFIRHLGYDAGIFGGIGITPVNPTVTNSMTSLEYDGMVFQKGLGAFITIDNFSVGLTLGFDNLLNSDSKIWIYNNKPYIGIAIGIANF
jgi:hypothetical protein